MATVTRHYCDKCRQEILTGRVELDLISGNLRSRRDSIELCRPCSEAFEGWLTGSALVGPPKAESFALAGT